MRPASTAVGSERERRRDVRAATNAAVEQDLEPVTGGLDDRGQSLDRRQHAVELAPAVVRDDDARGTVLGREHRVCRLEDALDDDRHRG